MSPAPHTTWCIENAEISVRENCASILTAEAWDRDAMERENAWVTMWAEEWVADGTSECKCS